MVITFLLHVIEKLETNAKIFNQTKCNYYEKTKERILHLSTRFIISFLFQVYLYSEKKVGEKRMGNVYAVN